MKRPAHKPPKKHQPGQQQPHYATTTCVHLHNRSNTTQSHLTPVEGPCPEAGRGLGCRVHGVERHKDEADAGLLLFAGRAGPRNVDRLDRSELLALFLKAKRKCESRAGSGGVRWSRGAHSFQTTRYRPEKRVQFHSPRK